MSKAEIVPYAAESLEARVQYAETLARAGDLIPKALHDNVRDPETNAVKGTAPNPGKVLLVMETGAMLGLHPVAAFQGVHVIEGKATLSAALMSGLVRSAGHLLDVREEGSIEGGDYKATATLQRRLAGPMGGFTNDGEPHSVTWTPHRAVRAELADDYAANDAGVWIVKAASREGNRLAWAKYTEGLCKARAIAEVCRDNAEDVLMGIAYTPEELGAAVNSLGEPVEIPGEAEASQEQPPAAPPAAKPARKRATTGRQGTKRTPTASPAEIEAALAETETPPGMAEAGEGAPESERDADGMPEGMEAAPEDIVDAEVVEEPEPLQAPDAPAEEPAAETPPAEPEPSGEGDEQISEAEWIELGNLAGDLTVLRSVWDRAAAVNALSAELQQSLLVRKGKLEADAAAVATGGKPNAERGSGRAAVLED